ncbi:hypothetical protein Tco_1284818 [Tanacetum coccineum]
MEPKRSSIKTESASKSTDKGPRRKEIDNVGGESTIWKFGSVRVLKLQDVPDVECFTSEVWFEGRLIMSICSQAWMEGHVGDEAVHKELGDKMERAATTASSLEAEQDNDAQTRFEAASKQSNDPPLSRVNTLGSGEDSMKLLELMAYCTKLSELVRKRIKRISELKNRKSELFWETSSASTPANGEMEITATIDGKVKTVNEASIRRHLKLEDADGIRSLPNTEIFEQLALMGPKKTAREQFSSNIATAIICLATNRTFNFSKMIFEGSIQQGEGSTVPVESYPTPISAPSTSQPPTTLPSMQTTHDAEEPATMPHDSSHPKVQSLGSDDGSLTLNELTVLCTTLSKKVEDLQSDLKQIKLNYGVAYTKLIMRVKKLEHIVKSSQPRRRARVVISDTEEDLEDPSKQGRKITEIDQNLSISLVQDEGTSWIQEDAEIQGRTSADTEILLDQEEPTELVEDLGSGEKGKKEISTDNVPISTASAIPKVSTVGPSSSTAEVFEDEMMTIAESLVVIRRTRPRTTSVVIHDPEKSQEEQCQNQQHNHTHLTKTREKKR